MVNGDALKASFWVHTKWGALCCGLLALFAFTLNIMICSSSPSHSFTLVLSRRRFTSFILLLVLIAVIVDGKKSSETPFSVAAGQRRDDGFAKSRP